MPPEPAPNTTAAPADPPGFEYASAPLEGPLRARVEGSSWRPGCPVPIEDLRYVTVSHWGFDGVPHSGELVVHHDAVAGLRTVMVELFAARFPIRAMRLVDDFGADDFASIEADNTSAFNCRPRAGGAGEWSEHAYGRAIDVNPVENPYVTAGGGTAHGRSVPFLDRSNVRPGMIVEGDAVVRAFAAIGWHWGGAWPGPIDHQHFSSTGR